MNRRSRFFAISALFACYLVGAAVAAQAQETPAPAAPAPEASPSLLDRQYDGHWHVTLAPYIWAPSVGGNFQYQIPNLPTRPGGVGTFSASVGPSDYLPKINSAVMFGVDARQGNFDIFGDYNYLNATVNATTAGIFAGPGGRHNIPVSIASSAHLRLSIWDAAAGYTVARGHDADLSIFAGMREFPLNFSFNYDATIGPVGRRGLTFTHSGSIATADIAQDVIFGLRGKAFFGDSHVFVPYYGDLGTAIGQLSNQTWQAYGGAGYAFNHGQTIVVLYRALGYYGFSPVSHVQKLEMYGPLLGYTFNI